jgi:uridine kinase
MADRAFVIGLSGVPDAGKTTLMRRLAQDYSGAQIIQFDRFLRATGMRTGQARDWFERSADPNEFDLPELIEELTRRTRMAPGDGRRSLVLFETPFARLHHASGAFIDFLVWIDTPLDIALSRATLAFLGQALSDRAPHAPTNFLKWQRRYLVNYQTLRAMYVAQQATISPTADLVLDGARPAEESAALVRKALARRGVEM